SAGVALLEDGHIKIYKRAGKLAALCAQLNGRNCSGTVGIGHTRWATHGQPTDQNAHPHSDCGGRFVVVHNGIIENYLELREWLAAEGHVFHSETDTEVLPHLVEHFYDGDLLSTVIRMMEKVRGSYAMVALSTLESGRLVAARRDSPLVVGLGKEENFFASDIPAILPYTRTAQILADGEVAAITREGAAVWDMAGRSVNRPVFSVTWDAAQAEKGGYAHYMLKEIHEQPRAIKDTLRGRLADGGRVQLGEISLPAEELKEVEKIVVTACGTAYHAGLVGKYVLERLLRIPVETEIASEFRYREPLVGRRSPVVVISQSGETADSLAALREAKKLGAPVIAITNVVGSSIAREADHVLYTWAGPEIAVASTKAYTAQLVALYLLALHLAGLRGTVPAGEMEEIAGGLKKLPEKAQAVLDDSAEIKRLAEECAKAKDAFFIGRGLDCAVAMEGSLKLKEISYIHAEAYAAGELKHGTLALIEEGVPVIALATQPHLLEKMVSNIKEVKARGATVFALAMEGAPGVAKVADRTFFIPATHPVLAPVLAVIPLQLLAYHAAVARGCDVDQPRNLAKSVTVE
ncbi:MAG: glutamine--fructose-6-phosphate transaminase (isomerizing), partial [Desulfotomaculales bacterium]